MALFKKKNTKEPIRQPRLMTGQGPDYTFRRSRTLTGTTSPKVNPSAEPRSQLKTPRLKEHELRQQRARVGRLLLFISLCIGIVAFLLVNFIGDFRFTYPQQVANTTPQTAQYQHSLSEYFIDHPFERFGFALNSKQLEAYMREKHAEIIGLAVERNWYGGGVQFVAYFRTPILVWQVGSKRFYVDDQGIAFRYDHFGTPLVSVTDQSGIAPDSGNSVASQRFLKFLGKMVGAVNAGGKGKVISVVIPASTREIDLRLEGRDYPIKTHIDRDPLQQAEDIVSALNYFDNKKTKPEYIDVRVAGKAFYK